MRKLISPFLSLVVFSLFGAAILAHPACVGPSESSKPSLKINSFYGEGGFDMVVENVPLLGDVPIVAEASYVVLDPLTGESARCPVLVTRTGLEEEQRGTHPSADAECLKAFGVHPMLKAVESTFRPDAGAAEPVEPVEAASGGAASGAVGHPAPVYE